MYSFGAQFFCLKYKKKQLPKTPRQETTVLMIGD